MQRYQQQSTSMHYPPTSFIPTQQMERYDWTTGRLNMTNYNQLQQSNPPQNITSTCSTNLLNSYQQQQRFLLSKINWNFFENLTFETAFIFFSALSRFKTFNYLFFELYTTDL